MKEKYSLEVDLIYTKLYCIYLSGMTSTVNFLCILLFFYPNCRYFIVSILLKDYSVSVYIRENLYKNRYTYKARVSYHDYGQHFTLMLVNISNLHRVLLTKNRNSICEALKKFPKFSSFRQRSSLNKEWEKTSVLSPYYQARKKEWLHTAARGQKGASYCA